MFSDYDWKCLEIFFLVASDILSLTLGIGLYDERKIAIGAYNEVGEGNHIAVLISQHEDLIKWGTEIYETYREEALPPAESDC